ncbi:MAG: NAD(P)H-dependent oxidoreductase [Spirochaetia bacterium]
MGNRIPYPHGFVLVYPKYNWGYPAVLKNALDYLYDEWARKPVNIVLWQSRRLSGHFGLEAGDAGAAHVQHVHQSST